MNGEILRSACLNSFSPWSKSEMATAQRTRPHHRYVILQLDCAFNVKRLSQTCNNLNLRAAILELPAWTNAAYLSLRKNGGK